MSRIQWWRGMRGKTTCVLLLAWYTARSIVRAYIDCMLLASISQNFSSDSTSTPMQMSSQVWTVLYNICVYIHKIYLKRMATYVRMYLHTVFRDYLLCWLYWMLKILCMYRATCPFLFITPHFFVFPCCIFSSKYSVAYHIAIYACTYA